MKKLCVSKLCVGGRREEAGGRSAGMHNQKQEPHTKMWGKTAAIQKSCTASYWLVVSIPLKNMSSSGWIIIPAIGETSLFRASQKDENKL